MNLLVSFIAAALGVYATEIGWSLAGGTDDPPVWLAWLGAIYVAVRVGLDRERES